MLVLSRKYLESVILTMPDGRIIKVTMLEIRGDKVRLGFMAPQDVTIWRDEIQEQIDAKERA